MPFNFHRKLFRSIGRKANISKHRDGPNMINFEKEIRDAAFDEDVPPLKVMRE